MKNQALSYKAFVDKLRDNEVDALKANPVLVVCNDGECSDRIAGAIRKRGLEAICCPSVTDARSLLSQLRFSLVLCSDTLPDGEARSVIRVAGTVPLIVLSRRAEWEAYLDALEYGAFDYISCPPSDIAETDRILRLALNRSVP